MSDLPRRRRSGTAPAATAIATAARDPAMLVAAILQPGEAVRWQGRPAVRWSPDGMTQGCFGIPALAIGLLGTVALGLGLVGGGAPATTRVAIAAFLLVPLTMAVIGAFLLTAPVRARWAATRTLHLVTDRRLLTIVAGRHASYVALHPANLGPVHLAVGPDGVGTIAIETHSWHEPQSPVDITQTQGWAGVPDAATAYRLIETMKAEEPRR